MHESHDGDFNITLTNVSIHRGEDLTLLCEVNKENPPYDNWKVCEWERHIGTEDITCSFIYTRWNGSYDHWNYTTDNEHSCQKRSKIVYLNQSHDSKQGESNEVCQLKLGWARLDDKGPWSCSLTLCKGPENGGCENPGRSNVTTTATLNVEVCI